MPRSKQVQQFHVRVWRGLWWNSLEHFSLENKLTGHVLEGFIVGIMEKKPFNLHYRITCDSKWQTRQAEITTTHGQERKQLNLVVDKKNRWLQDDHELARVRGARDIDINMTPSTNMLPIKRLHLGPGKSGEITTAWVQFPKMTITPGQQTLHQPRPSSIPVQEQPAQDRDQGRPARYCGELSALLEDGSLDDCS